MSVQGRKKNSDDNVVPICCKCEATKRRESVFGYCKNCQIHLCYKCYQCHKTDKSSVYHDMEKTTPIPAKDPLPKCPQHEDEELKYHCRRHDEIGCIACMLSHKSCETDYIPDISVQYASLDEYIDLQVSMQSLNERLSQNLKKVKENLLLSETAFQITTDAIKARKIELIEYINEQEQKVRNEAEAYIKESKDKMAKVQSDLNQLETEMLNTNKVLSNLKKEKRHNLLFIEAKHAAKVTVKHFERMYEISARNLVNDMSYLPTTKHIKDDTIFGKVVIENLKQRQYSSPELLDNRESTQVNIKSESDKKVCYATGLAFLSADHLAIADKANKNVKIVDVSHDKIVSHIELTSSPRDITVIPPDQLAVTLRDEERIQLLTTLKGLTKTEQIQTNGNCRGIKHDDGKLIVAFDSMVRPKIEILRLNGDVLCTFQLNESGSMIFSEPKCIGLSPDSSRMYVSDLSKMCIFNLSRLGNVNGTFGRHRYMGLAVSAGGSVYACSKSSNSVYQMQDDLSNDEAVLTIIDGIKAPIALAISNTRNVLYVSCGSNDADVSNKLHVFKIKHKNENTSIDISSEIA
ncbi:uncharacterized protein LOC132735237 [Ruditapes philippinarum]|uniref:uncharacterized protein LOC132735237 n=1 Tax=Ruditapes philippinarum TaxID=129788 RepID=UPI00295B3006|nr:uncharacterized protein LOC132735237 [Ruditapes philippinarum]